MEGFVTFNRHSSIYDALSAFMAAMLTNTIEQRSSKVEFQYLINGQPSLILFSYCLAEALPEIKQLVSHSGYAKLPDEDLEVPFDLLFTGNGCQGVKEYKDIQTGIEALRAIGVNPIINRLNKIFSTYAHVRIMCEKYSTDMPKSHLVKFVEERIGFTHDSLPGGSDNWGVDLPAESKEGLEKNIRSARGDNETTIYHVMFIPNKHR